MTATGTGLRHRAPAASRSVGVGLKPQHANDILGDPNPGPVGWFEVHAENYMGAGGPPHAFLTAIAERWPVSLHGVGASLGAEDPPDPAHLARLRRLVDRYQPFRFSEHLAWSTHDGRFLNDLLPMAYDDDTLHRVVRHVDALQNAIGRAMLLENPSTYLAYSQSHIEEIDFLGEVAARSGCGLLLDVNNVFVCATNHGFDAAAYLRRFPLRHVGEIHLAGHAHATDDDGAPLLIDAHDRPVSDEVWALFGNVIARIPDVPVLVEWDHPVPTWRVLESQAGQAARIISDVRDTVRHVA